MEFPPDERKRKIDKIGGVVAVLATLGMLGFFVYRDININSENERHNAEMAALLRDDGFLPTAKSETHDSEAKPYVLFGSFTIGACEFSNVVADVKLADEHVVDVSNYRIPISNSQTTSSTVRIQKMSQLRSALPGLNCFPE